VKALDIAVVVPLKIADVGPDVDALVNGFTVSALRHLTALGTAPLIVDVSADVPVPKQRVLQCDGIVLLGGGDIAPELYGHRGNAPNSYGVDRRADRYSIDLVRRARAIDVPMLGICRGSQVLNVAFGGTLIPDIADHSLHHGVSPDPTFLDEKVTLIDGSWLRKAFGRSDLVVRSGHHQAVDVVAQGFRVAAVAHDGIVESIESVHGWCVGVQWHPEDRDGSDEDARTIFAAFVDELAARRAVDVGWDAEPYHLSTVQQTDGF
jgi:putative glutamine amidotransferase